MFKKLFQIAFLCAAILTVNGCGGEDEPENLSIGSDKVSFTEAGGLSTISVIANCKWTASAADGSWLTVSPKSGSGNGTVSFTASANSSDRRSTTVTISSASVSKTVSVTQDATSQQPGITYTSLKDVRAMYNGSDFKITSDIVVKASVISNYRAVDNGGFNNYTSQKAIVIADETGGIQLFCTENNTAFALGDEVEVTLTGQTLSVYNNGPLQVNGIPLDKITKVGTNRKSPILITAAQLVAGNYESQYVAVSDVEIATSDMGKTFATSDDHTSINFVSKTGETFVIFSSKYSSFLNEKVPTGSGTLKGIAAKFGEVIQISIAATSDYTGLTGYRFAVGGEDASLKSIKEVRDMYKGTDYTITDNIMISGTIISNYRKEAYGGLNNSTSAKTIVVSDGEAGIMLYCTSENTNFAFGDAVNINLKGQVLSVFETGPLQVNGLPLDNIEKTGTKAVMAKEISATDFLSGNDESIYVAIPDVQVINEDLDKTFSSSEEHTSIMLESKTGEFFDIFSSKYSTFRNVKVPQGSGTIKGIAGHYGNDKQISFTSVSDYAGLTGERFSSNKRLGLDFTEINVIGDAGSFVVNISANVKWKASSSDSDFTLSQTEGSESAALTVTYKDNPSSESSRKVIITFTTDDASVTVKTVGLTITQDPFDLLESDDVMPWLELPEIKAAEGFAFVTHDIELNGDRVRNYSFWFDSVNHLSYWVAYPLYNDIIGSGSRTEEWEYDPKVPQRCQAKLYKGFGSAIYSRGHQIPSADRLTSDAVNATTFYFTNITAQNESLNGSIWANLEDKVRKWAKAVDTVYVVTGAVITTNEDKTVTYIQDNEGKDVAIPKAYYKVLLKYDKSSSANGGYSAIGFWLDNKSYTSSTISTSQTKSVDEIEALTGFDFFHNLDNAIETSIEASYTASDWGL